MRVLVLAPWIPYPPHSWGAAARVFQIVKHLSERHSVTLLAYGDGADSEGVACLERLGVGVHVVDPPRHRKRVQQLRSLMSATSYEAGAMRSSAMTQALGALAARLEPDSVLIEFSQLASAVASPGIDFVVDEHNVEYELHGRLAAVEHDLSRKAFNALESIKLRVEEQRVWRRARACLVTSDRERLLVESAAPATRVAVIPNGIDLAYYADDGPTDRVKQSIVFVGRMGYRPNADAATYFARRILPLVLERHPDATFWVVGQDPPPEVRALAGRNVMVTGRVDDVRGYVSRAAVVVAPIRAGSGTRLKILEALAMRKAVVTTTLAAEGLDLTPGQDLIVADDPVAFSEAIHRLFDDNALSMRLGEGGRAVVESRYTWRRVLSGLDSAVAAGLGSRSTRDPASVLSLPSA